MVAGRLSVGRYDNDTKKTIWGIFDVSTGADVTPPIGSHQVNTMWMLTAPIVRPGHQESTTTTVPTTTAPAFRAPTFDELEASFPSSICDSDSGSIRFDSAGNWSNSKSDTDPGYISISLGPTNYQKADVDGDGAAEALVVPTCSRGGNSYWTPVAAVRAGPDGRVVVVGNPIKSFGKGGRDVEELSMDGGTLVITGKQWVEGDPFGAPSKPYVLRYKLVDGTWVQQP
ncbi:MAG: hypothetical protein JST64_03625 [Actinobacteria bacterium]|nr:hypothetical protein [Actinomycetota bacterium]